MKSNPCTFFIFFFSIILFIGCNSTNPKNPSQLNTPNEKGNYTIDKNQLLHNIKSLASDSLEGRGFGKPGNYKAQQLIANEFKRL